MISALQVPPLASEETASAARLLRGIELPCGMNSW
jgi:hypothetical protein